MGAEYQAWTPSWGQALAIRPSRRPRGRTEALRRELLLARQVTHKNVVRIHDPARSAASHHDVVRKGSTSRPSWQLKAPAGPRAIRVARTRWSGPWPHQARVVHRDLKPANI
jgi:serine/threonine protein kinase